MAPLSVTPAKAGMTEGVVAGRAEAPAKAIVAGRRLRRWSLAIAAMAMAAPTLADPTMAPDPLAYSQLPDARQEKAAAALMATIRCVVCQGQAIADSDADLAGDMRALIRHRIAAGEKPEAVRRWLVSRYGEWVSYRPPVEPVTWPLWAAPLLLVALGAWIARATLRRRSRR